MEQKQQRLHIETLYWLSDVMKAGDKKTFSPADIDRINQVKDMLDCDPKHEYIISGNTVTKISKL